MSLNFADRGRPFACLLFPTLIAACIAALALLQSVPSVATAHAVFFGAAGNVPLQATQVATQTFASVVLEWTTKSEVNTAGFNMFRAENSDGPFVQINRALIPSAGDPIAGGHYVFTDTEAVAGRTYYYQLEDVELSGNRTRHDTITTTAQAAVATFAGADISVVLYTLGALALIMGLGFVLWRIRR